MSIFWKNLNNLAKKCSTTPAGLVHSSPATQLDARERELVLSATLKINTLKKIICCYVRTYVRRDRAYEKNIVLSKN